MYSAFDLERFITAQEKQYPAALYVIPEIKNSLSYEANVFAIRIF